MYFTMKNKYIKQFVVKKCKMYIKLLVYKIKTNIKDNHQSNRTITCYLRIPSVLGSGIGSKKHF